jgi:hypothetical protein
MEDAAYPGLAKAASAAIGTSPMGRSSHPGFHGKVARPYWQEALSNSLSSA